MLIDATHPEETRVAVVDGTRLEEFDFEIASRRQIKSNIYLAKITRVEPSLQAAFVEYGGNRHGFLPFPEIHPDYYRIPVGDRRAFSDESDRRWRDERWDNQTADSGDSAGAPQSQDFEPESGQSESYAETIADAPETADSYFDSENATDAQIGYESVSSHDTAPTDEPDAAADDYSDRDDLVSYMAAEAERDTAIDERFRSADSANDDHGAHDDHAPAAAEDDNAPSDLGPPAADDEDPSSQPAAASEDEIATDAAAAVDVVGGDEVEDAQRRRRSQMPHYKIQEVIKRRQIMLVQVSKEERGNKGAAVTTFLSLPGRYCVLMPNTSRGGGVSRKIANPADRKRMKELISDLEVPEGMSVILRTAGVERSKAEIKRDLEYLLRLWENIRTLTLESTAPALIYEEGNLVKRAIRDLYTRDIGEIEIAGEEGYRQAKDFMRMLMPSHAKRVQPYRDPSIPLFFRYQVETQIDLIHNPVAHLRSGGYIVINQTEALVSIDVNSGRSTRERNIEETALKTNCEAADEIARQLRLRDMGGLIVIDFIDMDEPRHDAQVERRLKEAMKNDRARIQVGRISPFGLLELSRQRLHPSLIETNFHTCAHCLGTGLVRSIESAALLVLRAIEEEGIKRRSAELGVTVAGNIALYILNQKRGMLIDIEQRYGFTVRIMADDSLIAPEHRIERIRLKPPGSELPPSVSLTKVMAADEDEDEPEEEVEETKEFKEAAEPKEGRESRDAREPKDSREAAPGSEAAEAGADVKRKRRRNRRRRGRDGRPDEQQNADGALQPLESAEEEATDAEPGEDEAEGEAEPREDAGIHVGPAQEADGDVDGAGRRRRRGRRGGRSRPRREDGRNGALPDTPLAEPLAAEPSAAETFGVETFEADSLNEGWQRDEEAAPAEPSPADENVAAEAEAVAIDLVAPTEPEPVEDYQPAWEPAPEIAADRTPVAELHPVADTGEPAADEPAVPAPEPSPAAGGHAAINGAADREAPAGRDYEIVNQPPEQPRRGWWKRLVE
jgi:ribonuclease E